MNRPWLAHYPPGVPHDVDPSQYRSLAALLEESLRQNARHPVSVCMERWMSYGELDEHSNALGAWLGALADWSAQQQQAQALAEGPGLEQQAQQLAAMSRGADGVLQEECVQLQLELFSAAFAEVCR